MASDRDDVAEHLRLGAEFDIAADRNDFAGHPAVDLRLAADRYRVAANLSVDLDVAADRDNVIDHFAPAHPHGAAERDPVVEVDDNVDPVQVTLEIVQPLDRLLDRVPSIFADFLERFVETFSCILEG